MHTRIFRDSTQSSRNLLTIITQSSGVDQALFDPFPFHRFSCTL